jgi:hypothetical protein
VTALATTRTITRRPTARLLRDKAGPRLAVVAAPDAEPVLADVAPVATASVVYRAYQDDAYLALRVLVPRDVAGQVTAVRLGLGVPDGFEPLVVFSEDGREHCAWAPLPGGAWPATHAGRLVCVDVEVMSEAGPVPFRLAYPADDGALTMAESPKGRRVRVRALARSSANWV